MTSGQSNPVNVPRSRLRWVRRALWWLGGLLLLLAFCWGVGALAMRSSTNVLALASVIRSWRLWGAAVQTVLVALVIVRWEALVQWGLHHGWVKPHELDRARAMRARSALFLVAYLVMIPVGPATLFQLMAG